MTDALIWEHKKSGTSCNIPQKTFIAPENRLFE